jgi:hypothetical protein
VTRSSGRTGTKAAGQAVAQPVEPRQEAFAGQAELDLAGGHQRAIP